VQAAANGCETDKALGKSNLEKLKEKKKLIDEQGIVLFRKKGTKVYIAPPWRTDRNRHAEKKEETPFPGYRQGVKRTDATADEPGRKKEEAPPSPPSPRRARKRESNTPSPRRARHVVADSTGLGYHQQRVDHYRRVERAVPAVFEQCYRMIEQSVANKKVASACQRRPDKRVAGIVKPGDKRVDLGDSSEDSEATDVDSEASMWALSERSLRREEAATNRQIKRHGCLGRKGPM